ncbi:hypothetical protein Pint_13679 [Pistacia integerrima]|uniref:Uncharacterized protein n=1 Tax=Pistacia integerrima TaxID=434235 RepID=A0ACC0Y8N0_9ROSI|nr:hypothetical protein Pint_13679 [Pistacia integerrima]
MRYIFMKVKKHLEYFLKYYLFLEIPNNNSFELLNKMIIMHVAQDHVSRSQTPLVHHPIISAIDF